MCLAEVKKPDSDGFCGFQKMLKGGGLFNLCDFTFLRLTQRRKSKSAEQNSYSPAGENPSLEEKLATISEPNPAPKYW